MTVQLPIMFEVQSWPEGMGKSAVAPYVKVEALDELDAARRFLRIPLQRDARRDMYVRALVRKLGHNGVTTRIYAAE
jgi:hypothetical protein